MINFLGYLGYKRKAMNAHGLHSPLVYDLYTDILADKKEFYDFQHIEQLSKKKGDFQAKEAQLLYQLLNKYKLKKGVIIGTGKESMKSILKTIAQDIAIQFDYHPEEKYDFIHFTTDCTPSDINKTSLIAQLSNIQFISISNPHGEKNRNRLWKELVSHTNVRVTIDLWSMGLCFPNNNQRKQHFTLQNKHFQF